MTMLNPAATLADEALVTAELSTSWPARLEAALDKTGEYLNPILVKECRQALKSKQFLITFSLVLLCAWGWSILGVALQGPEIYFSFSGPDIFYIYYLVLAFPLLIIVPYGAFRSLAGEREDRTYELLAITTLKPRQVISGKLGSAVIQMIVYFSAVSPCLAFTYMLRGIDVLTIVFMLIYIFAASLAFSLLALLVATVTAEKHWQVVLSVVLILGLAFAFIMTCGLSYEMLSWSHLGFDDEEFWIAHLAMLTAYVSYFAMFYFAAAAQLTFSSDNRSTPLRVVMLVQFLLFSGWMAWILWMEGGFSEPDLGGMLVVYLVFIGLHWYVMGTLLCGEWPYLSPRVKRQLPQSFLGRSLFTWFNPGPGTGFMFALGNLLAAVVTALAMLLAWYWINPAVATGSRWATPDRVLIFIAAGYSYVVIYLGLGRVIVNLLQRVAPVGIALSLLVQILLLVAGCGIPLIIYLMSYSRGDGYTMLQITNPIWTLVELIDSNTGMAYAPAILLTLLPAAVLIFLANLPGIAAEVRHVRIAKPLRVAQEDALAEAQKAPPRQKTNPWDDDQ
jgi:hypothetical protein